MTNIFSNYLTPYNLKIDGKYIINLLRMSAAQSFNSIPDLVGPLMSKEELLRQLLRKKLSIGQIFDAISARFSNVSVEELLELVKSSSLVSKLEILLQLVVSGVIYDMGVATVLTEMFFGSEKESEESFFAVIAIVQLLRLPSSEVSSMQDQSIEELKGLFRSSLFHDDIVIHFMSFRDEKQQNAQRCPCPNCNARYIISIGWYIVAQDAHNDNAFVKNEG
jgi:hypothetical protein